jgi:hypothetical protein
MACAAREQHDIARLQEQRVARGCAQPDSALRNEVKKGCSLLRRKLQSEGRLELASAVGRPGQAKILQHLAQSIRL